MAFATELNPSTVYVNHEFAANLTGQREAPPVDTQANGHTILVQNMPQNETVQYFVNVTEIQGKTQGHIHSAAEGENSPIVVTLFKFDSPQNEIYKKVTLPLPLVC
jgi:hypothetical protein